ncbi:MAG: hypothetical protein GY807_11705, partial [Gammaproteobacteria bacterium]|nr:hypothetical protein [Gammaproteobacteria bacterium]
IHPQLDPDDDNDPIQINILQVLCDTDTVLHDIRDVPLVDSPALGRFSLHYVNAAQGKLSSPKDVTDTPKMAIFDAAFRDEKTDMQAIMRELEAVVYSQRYLKNIRALFTEKLGINNAPNFKPLEQLLSEIENLLSVRLPRPTPVKEDTSQGDVTQSEETAAVETMTQVPTPVFKAGQINSREDAILLLDKVCEYFEQQEPSSPVPLLLKRAKRLVAMDFMEILRDLAPNGVQQVEVIRGPEQKGNI